MRGHFLQLLSVSRDKKILSFEDYESEIKSHWAVQHLNNKERLPGTQLHLTLNTNLFCLLFPFTSFFFILVLFCFDNLNEKLKLTKKWKIGKENYCFIPLIINFFCYQLIPTNNQLLLNITISMILFFQKKKFYNHF